MKEYLHRKALREMYSLGNFAIELVIAVLPPDVRAGRAAGWDDARAIGFGVAAGLCDPFGRPVFTNGGCHRKPGDLYVRAHIPIELRVQMQRIRAHNLRPLPDPRRWHTQTRVFADISAVARILGRCNSRITQMHRAGTLEPPVIRVGPKVRYRRDGSAFGWDPDAVRRFGEETKRLRDGEIVRFVQQDRKPVMQVVVPRCLRPRSRARKGGGELCQALRRRTSDGWAPACWEHMTSVEHQVLAVAE